MEKKDLIITVSGQTNSGKTRLTYLLKKFLREQGFEVLFDGGCDYTKEHEFDENVSLNFDKVIESIKENRKITLKETQLNTFGEFQQIIDGNYKFKPSRIVKGHGF